MAKKTKKQLIAAAAPLPMERKVAEICKRIVKKNTLNETRDWMLRKHGDASLSRSLWNSLCDGTYAEGQGRAATFYANHWADEIRKSQIACCSVVADMATPPVEPPPPQEDESKWRAVRQLCEYFDIPAADVVFMVVAHAQERRA